MPTRVLILLLLGCLPANAQPDDAYFATVTYAESVQLALQKNFAIAGAAYDPLVSRAKLRSSEGKFDPVLTLAYTRDDNEEDLTGLNITG